MSRACASRSTRGRSTISASGPTSATFCDSWRGSITNTEYILLCREPDLGIAAQLGPNFRGVARALTQLLAARTDSRAVGASPRTAGRLPRAALRAAAGRPLPIGRDDSRLHPPDVSAVPAESRWRMPMRGRRCGPRRDDPICILTVSEASKRDILHFFNVPPEKIVVVYNAIDEHFCATPSEEQVARVRERYQLDHKFVLYVGNIKPHKNLVRLIEAFSRAAAQRHDDLKLLIIGDEISKLPALRRAVHRHKLHKYVRFLGYVTDDTLAVLYRLASVFVFPSLYEGFGLPPLEAMASGTPVVTSNVSSLPEVTGDAAVLVDPYDVDSIADGMRRVLDDPRLAEEMRRQGTEAGARVLVGALGREDAACLSRSGRGRARLARWSIWPGERASSRARPRLADRDARRREGARGAVRDVPATPTSSRWSIGKGSVSPTIERHRIRTSCRPAPADGRDDDTANYLPLFPFAIEQLSLDGYDLVISSSHCAAKSVVVPGRAVHVCYCHSPMRYAWDQFDAYFGPARVGRVKSRWLYRPVLSRLARWDASTAGRVHSLPGQFGARCRPDPPIL